MECFAEPRELTSEEFANLLEERVQASLNMSVADFIAGLENGRLDPESPRVAGLAILVGARARALRKRRGEQRSVET